MIVKHNVVRSRSCGLISYVSPSVADCGVNCHRHCRNQVGLECIKRFKTSAGSCPCTATPDVKAKANSWCELLLLPCRLITSASAVL